MLLDNHLNGSAELRADAAAAIEAVVLAFSRTRVLAGERMVAYINWCFENNVALPSLSKLGPQNASLFVLDAFFYGRESDKENYNQDDRPFATFLREHDVAGVMLPRVAGDRAAIADAALNFSEYWGRRMT